MYLYLSRDQINKTYFCKCPRYNVDQYNTKSYITRLDFRLQLVGSIKVHFSRNGMKSATDRSNFSNSI